MYSSLASPCSPLVFFVFHSVQLPWSSCFPLVFFVFHDMFSFRGLLFSPGLLRLPWHVQLPWSLVFLWSSSSSIAYSAWSSCSPLIFFVFHDSFCCASVTNLLPRWLLVLPVDSSSYYSLLLVCLLRIPVRLYYCSSLALCIPAAKVQNENIILYMYNIFEGKRERKCKNNGRQDQPETNTRMLALTRICHFFSQIECSGECTCCNMYTDCTCYNMYTNMYKVPMYMLVYMLG